MAARGGTEHHPLANHAPCNDNYNYNYDHNYDYNYAYSYAYNDAYNYDYNVSDTTRERLWRVVMLMRKPSWISKGFAKFHRPLEGVRHHR